MSDRSQPAHDLKSTDTSPPGAPPDRDADYEAPALTVLGDVRSITMGGTPGAGDSLGGLESQPSPYGEPPGPPGPAGG